MTGHLKVGGGRGRKACGAQSLDTCSHTCLHTWKRAQGCRVLDGAHAHAYVWKTAQVCMATYADMHMNVGASQLVLVVKSSPVKAGDARDVGSTPVSGKIPWGRARQPTPGFLSGESHGQRSLAGCSPQDCGESDTTEATQPALTHTDARAHTSSPHTRDDRVGLPGRQQARGRVCRTNRHIDSLTTALSPPSEVAWPR